MASVTQCLECGADIPADARGVCGRCLLKLGLASQHPAGLIESGEKPPPLPGSDSHDSRRHLVVEPFEFGGYRILRLLGKGGMGAVYEAEDLASGRRVALKVLGHSLDSPETRKRFLREGRLAASINHPNSVYVYGTEEIEGAPVITMELVPGGTLHDLVKAGGPLPITEAVDAVLQVIAGLEAAHAVGILHRDIKPSNCFIDPNGTVKIGDFGLSISTLSRGDSALTLAGSILGTPEFASPEQLRGEELSVRSDIYSVGMTLYYLLTGKTPFHADNVVQLLATVLEKPAPSPRNVRPEIPEAVACIVLRCLAKQAGDRFASYDELRRVLLHFNSTAPTPATLGWRFVAGLIDQAVTTPLTMLLSLIVYQDLLAFTDPAMVGTPQWLWLSLGLIALDLAYFAIPEGLWGASAGKALVGLRVARLNRSAPGIPKALLRAAIWSLPSWVSFLLFMGMGNGWESSAWNNVVAVGSVLYTIALFSTARRRNGFAGLHDLLTKTRVIQKAAYQPRPAMIQAEEPVAATEALPKLGPYHVLATLAATENEAVVLGYDTKLLRRVWIRKMPVGVAAVPAALRNVARLGRLRWLQGRRTETEAWDAYESVSGTPFVNLLRAPQPWKSVRFWLLDLAEELNASSQDGSLPAGLALDRVWINADGRAKLIDFPVPGAESSAPRVEPLEVASQPGAVQVFLNQLAISALEGGAASADEARTRAPGVPLPLAARSFLHGLRAPVDFAALLERLKSLVHETPYVSRRRRFGLIAGCALPSVIFAAAMFAVVTSMDRWQKDHPELVPLKIILKDHAWARDEAAKPGTHPAWASVLRRDAQSMEIYIAGHFGDFIRNPRKQWNPPVGIEYIPADQRLDAEKIVAAHPRPTAEEMQAALVKLKSRLDEQGNVKERPVFDEHGNVTERPDAAGLTKETRRKLRDIAAGRPLAFTAVLSLLCALAFRGGPLLRLLGIGVVTRGGTDASRLRMLWRGCIAWSPTMLWAVLLSMLTPIMTLPLAVASAALLVIVPVIISAALPERSLQDRLASTWLVPR